MTSIAPFKNRKQRAATGILARVARNHYVRPPVFIAFKNARMLTRRFSQPRKRVNSPKPAKYEAPLPQPVPASLAISAKPPTELVDVGLTRDELDDLMCDREIFDMKGVRQMDNFRPDLS
jgi:hypothetical protein